jgi:FAD synthetase
MKGKVVLASGVFDLLHYGHYLFLREAKKAGGEGAKLYVIVARDSTVKRMKGKHPVMPEDLRRALVEALKPVDVALLGLEPLDFEKTLEKIRPDIIALGHDQGGMERTVRRIVKEKHLGVKIVRIPKFDLGIDSSSKLKKKVVDLWKGES